MRPPRVYATVPTHAHPDLLAALHGRWRVATRLVMILLSARGFHAAQVAELLGYHPAPCAAGSTATGSTASAAWPTGPAAAGPGWAAQTGPADPPAAAAAACLDHPQAGARAGPPPHRSAHPAPSGARGRRLAAAPPGRQGRPDRDQALATLRQHIACLPTGAVVLAEDETHLHLLPWVRATWILTGQRQRVMTPGKNRRRTIFGAVDVASGRFPIYQVCRKAVSATFTAFLEQVLAAYPAAPVVAVVCDNVIIHHSKLVQRWLASHPRVRVLHGARYSPHDNPVERVWGALKAWLANNPTVTIQGRVRQVHAFFRQRTPAQLLATATPRSSPWLPEGYGQDFREAA